MKIIDAHMHFSNIEEFKRTAKELSFVDYSYQGIIDEYKDNGVVLGIGMGVTEKEKGGFPDANAENPMGMDLASELPANIVYCAGVNPYHLDQSALERLEIEIQKPYVVGMKIYLGYYPFYAYDDVYQPVYELAKKYGLPVVFHTGDTYSERGLLKYSHPLTLDEVAVQHREVNFMMAHFGDPWMLDGAEVVYKNRNMYADLSGLIVGDKKDVLKMNDERFQHMRHALAYCNRYERLLFGTDWPLVQVGPYIDFIKEMIPEEYHEQVFFKTALKLFPKAAAFLQD
ncbi:amidohydrolase family protein [Bacillus horti]|uniref:TIM-barrel fold metal-dependent hydrolase n=1 Tax=Caldalkalibacillus horti TaxID=77523 RepID=A0ABT9W014_9BACI|nr:amidohydrolase family protein [Bacillus horti]MDQ0166596.1 putative TIM-barrel fold metal-dependent hydrolase [Bacillus horti]